MRTLNHTAEARLFIAQVRAREQTALDRVELALRRNDGDLTKTAADLGIARRTMHRWCDEIVVFGALRRGRIGRNWDAEPRPAKKAKRARKR